MRLLITAGMIGTFVCATPAMAANCATDAELDAAFADQVRTKVQIIRPGRYATIPLCSGLTLAQHLQKMRERAFPGEAEARVQRAVAARSEAEREAAAQAAATQQAGPMASPRYDRDEKPAPAIGKLVLTTAALGISLDELMDRVVYADSKSWMMNRYVRGSMRNARYLSTNKSKTTYVARGDYAFQGFAGGAGWVTINVRNGELHCLEFWDQPGTCRPLYHSLSQQNFVSAARDMMTGGGGSNPSASSGAIDDELARRRGSGTPPPPPPPPPTPPIGGANGLYGCAAPPCM